MEEEDDGQIGQAIERLFAVPENNDELPDLGKFERNICKVFLSKEGRTKIFQIV